MHAARVVCTHGSTNCLSTLSALRHSAGRSTGSGLPIYADRASIWVGEGLGGGEVR